MKTPTPSVQEWLAREVPHYECEDCWYSCATICCDEHRRSDKCDCGADEENRMRCRALSVLSEREVTWPVGDTQMTITKNQPDDKCHICGGAALTRGDGCGIEKCPYRGGPFSDDKQETSRTDAIENEASFEELADFARKLERELAEAQEHAQQADAESDHLRRQLLALSARGEIVEECAKVCDGFADEARSIWDAYISKCRENPDNIGSGSQSWHQLYERVAEAIRALKQTSYVGEKKVTRYEHEKAVIEALEILIFELRKGAAGPCDYWFKMLADRLVERIYPIEKQTSDIERKS